MNNIQIKKFTTFTKETLQTILHLENKIFPSPLTKEIIQQETEDKKDLLGLIAESNGISCGFKVGFRHSPGIFYSWIGGVDPDFRRRGIALLLMEEQHKLVKQLGFKYIRTCTKNRYREMLLLNIKAGFDVTGVQKKLKEAEHSIILEKEL